MEIEKFTQASIESVKTGNFLTETDFSALESMSQELQNNWEKRQIWRTETEMRVSVLNDIKFPDNAAKYWQCVREMGVFFENLATLSFDYRRNENQIKKLEKELSELKDTLEIESKQIDLDECLFKRRNMQIAAKDRVRELKLWSQLKLELDNGSFNTEDVNASQLGSFVKRFPKELDIAMQSKNASPAELRNIQALAQQTIKEASKRKIQIDAQNNRLILK